MSAAICQSFPLRPGYARLNGSQLGGLRDLVSGQARWFLVAAALVAIAAAVARAGAAPSRRRRGL